MSTQEKNIFAHVNVDQAIRHILEGTAADVGERFFRSLVESLAKVLNTTGAWVTEYIEKDRRLRPMAYQWPGNVRELQNVIERAVIISQDNAVSLKGLMPVIHKSEPTLRANEPTASPGRLLTEKDVRRTEKDNLLFALETTGWRVSGKKSAARLLGMNPSTLTSRLKKFGIRRP